ncbi:MAG TPA: helix-turn-helix transcriptional regulator [Thermodesulfobacteriota bacterium]
MTQALVLYPEQGRAITADLKAAGLSKRRAALLSGVDRVVVTNLANGVATANEETFRKLAAGIGRPEAAAGWQQAKERDKAGRVAGPGAPEVAPSGGFRDGEDDGPAGALAGRAGRPAARVAGTAAAGGDRDERVTRADLARLVARLEATLSEALGRPVNLSCQPVDRVLRPVWRGLPWPVGARAGNHEGRDAAAMRVERPFPSGCRQPSRLASLPAGLIREIVGPSSPSRPGASLTRRSGSRA